MSKLKQPRPAHGQAWGVLNPYGDLWTHETFRTSEEAMAHVAAFWRGNKSAGDISRFQPVRVWVTVSVQASKSDQEAT